MELYRNGTLKEIISRRLGISDFRYVEIESKKRVMPHQAIELKKYLMKKKKVEYVKTATFFDQFLDTPKMDLFRIGASLRIRYKKNGSRVYLQYKGPGFFDQGLLFRSEFSSRHLSHLFLEESHHDVIHFTQKSLKQIMRGHLSHPMKTLMKRQLGARIIDKISCGVIVAVYQKVKFAVDLGKAFLEPSLDHVSAFHINARGLHPLSTFWEYENEIKAGNQSLEAKLKRLPKLLEFDRNLAKKFSLKEERLDKYHRCASIILAPSLSSR